jgi:hypothetical protein|tara:strand:+ start:2556 stop:2999 length:444 start_codon:yes stop_codon:yes gene_type:complete
MKKFILLILLLNLTHCANTVQKSYCNVEVNKSLSKNDPKWFKKKENQEYNFIVKNKEYSGDKNLAQTKNLFISEIILANQVADDFMSCEDQNKALFTIRNSDSESINNLKNGKIIKNLVKGYRISNNETIEEDGKFTNYLRIIKLKK